MYKVCKTEQSANRQRELEQFLLKEMQTKHFDDITISDLCEGSGIPRKAFYRYFSGKRGALHALIDHTLSDFDTLTLELGKDNSQRAALELFFRFWQDQKRLLDAIERSNLWEEVMHRASEYAQTELDRKKRYLPQVQQTEGAYLTRFTVYGMMGIIQSWYRQGFTQSPGYMANLIFRNLTQALYYWNS